MAAGRKSSGADFSKPPIRKILLPKSPPSLAMEGRLPSLPRACKVTSPESDTLPGHSYYRRARGGWEASFPWATRAFKSCKSH